MEITTELLLELTEIANKEVAVLMEQRKECFAECKNLDCHEMLDTELKIRKLRAKIEAYDELIILLGSPASQKPWIFGCFHQNTRKS
jgi:hypothetical protein